MLMLDAGLRSGEVAALRWGDVVPRRDANDERRHLWIERSRPRGASENEPTKSGRPRSVGLSRRLAALLREARLRADRSGPADRIVPGFRSENYAARFFRPVLREAKVIGKFSPKNLRHTYASQLLTAGIPVAVIAKQLGHTRSSVTETHYPRYIDDEGYRRPTVVEDGEVPADLLAWLGEADRRASSEGGRRSG
jgi:integrase